LIRSRASNCSKINEDMATLTFEKYLEAFKSLSGVLAGVGTLIPAIAYFTRYSPPFLEESSLLTAAFAYYYSPKKRASSGNISTLVRLARKLLILAFALFIVYLVFLRICTALDPREGKQRFQIGFNRYEWSLSEEGRKLKTAHPNVSMRDFMLFGRAYSDERIEVIWKPWTVYLAGVLTILIFMFTFILWNFGWALIAKQKALSG
jgi:hypothetical protein